MDQANDNFPDEQDGGYQQPQRLACILGGALAPISNRSFKLLAHEVNATLLKPEAARRLRWSQYLIYFDVSDHPMTTRTVGAIPLVCTPTIHNVTVTKTLIDGGAGLNVLSVETFE